MTSVDETLDAAYARHQSGDIESARAAYKSVLYTDPAHPVALHYLALAVFQDGDSAKALTLLNDSIARAPGRAAAHADKGRFLGLMDDDAGAVQSFQQALALDERRTDTWHNLGLVLQKRGAAHEALNAFKKALRLAPDRADTLFALAKLLFTEGQTEQGQRALGLAIQADPSDAEARVLLAQSLADQGETDQALSQFRAIVKSHQDIPDAWVGLGQAAEDLGEAQEAENAYKRALALDAGNGVAIGRLLILQGENAEPALADLASKALEWPHVPNEARALAGYGLGKHRERLGDYSGAFAAYRTANDARRANAGAFDREAHAARIDTIIRIFDKKAFPQLPSAREETAGPDAQDGAAPVFIVGMPRSGTTLTEQILASHPSIWGAGELPGVPNASREIEAATGGSAPWPSCLEQASDAMMAQAAAGYLAALRANADAGVRWTVDKAPLNYFYLGFIALLFPDAKIIHCRRDPRDVCLSIFAENFAPSQAYATNLADLGYYWRCYDRLMRHWTDHLPLAMLHVDYQDTVSNLEPTARRLCDFLTVPWDPSCLDFHDTDRAVRTPSRWQVRQPVYKSAMGRWKRFEEHVTPLLDALGVDARD